MEMPDLLVDGYSIQLDRISCELNRYDSDVIFRDAAARSKSATACAVMALVHSLISSSSSVVDSFQQYCDTSLRPASGGLSRQLPHEVLTDLM